MSNWTTKIQKAQSKNPDSSNYKNQKTTYVPKNVAKEFIKEFYKKLT